MQHKELIRRVEQMAMAACQQVGVELWDVEFEKEGGQYVLTVTIDREEGVDIDHCEAVSRTIDPQLDAPEYNSLPAYTLCVSSAGLTRRLKKDSQYAKYMGERVEVGLYRPLNGMKQIEGTLLAHDNGNVTIDADGQTMIFEAKDIAAVRLTVVF